MRRLATVIGAAGIVVLGLGTLPTQAADCVAPKPTEELSGEEVQVIYDCIRSSLTAGYAKGGHEVGSAYSTWKAASTLPAAPGFHGERFLMTFVNDAGWDAYTDFKEEDVKMPVGTVIAKESFKVGKENKIKRGPLFIMTKVADGEAPETGDWVYDGVIPNGKTMKFKQSFCHDCHANWEAQDSLGYPEESVRVRK